MFNGLSEADAPDFEILKNHERYSQFLFPYNSLVSVSQFYINGCKEGIYPINTLKFTIDLFFWKQNLFSYNIY